LRKFELVDGSFQEQGASKWRTWWSRWGYYKQFGVLKAWKLLKLREALTRAFLDVQSVNPMLKTSLVGVPWIEIQGTDGVLQVKIERLPGLDEDEKLAELISVATRKDWEAFEVVDFWREPGGVYSVFMLEDVGSDKRLDVGSVISSTVPFKIVLQKGLVVDFEKSPGLGLFGKSGAGKTTTLLAFLAQFLAGGSQVYLVDGKNELQALSNVLQRASGVSDVLSMLGYVVAQMEQREAFLGKEGARRQRLGLKASEVGLTPLVVAIDELGAIVASAQAKEKAQLIALLTQIALKGRSSGVILVVASQFASVDTIPNAVRSQLSTKILLGGAPAELVRMVFPTASPGARSARQFEGFVYIDGQRGREPSRYQVPALGKLENVSKWGGFVTYYDTERALV
jgi:putative transposon protein